MQSHLITDYFVCSFPPYYAQEVATRDLSFALCANTSSEPACLRFSLLVVTPKMPVLFAQDTYRLKISRMHLGKDQLI
jgi:hypothetical protein